MMRSGGWISAQKSKHKFRPQIHACFFTAFLPVRFALVFLVYEKIASINHLFLGYATAAVLPLFCVRQNAWFMLAIPPNFFQKKWFRVPNFDTAKVILTPRFGSTSAHFSPCKCHLLPVKKFLRLVKKFFRLVKWRLLLDQLFLLLDKWFVLPVKKDLRPVEWFSKPVSRRKSLVNGENGLHQECFNGWHYSLHWCS